MAQTMTNHEILQIAMEQSAIDSNCSAEDFLSNHNKIVVSKNNPKARKYLELPFYCDLTSYGNGIVASVSENLTDIVEQYINKFPVEHCFETPNLLVLQEKIKPFGLDICFMAEYFLPDLNMVKPLDCGYELKILHPKDFEDFYLPEWSNALCDKRRQLDVLAVAAMDEGKNVGMAACSADCEAMWQIGVDVRLDYRCKGIASALTSTLAVEVLKQNKVPFYCCAWSNLKSVRNAIKSAFRPAWVQVTIKKTDFICNMNR